MERIRRRGVEALRAAVDAGGTHAYSPLRPWAWVWRQAALDDRFWKLEVEEPSLLILARTTSLSSMVDGDAPVANGGPADSGQEVGRARIRALPTPVRALGTIKK
eukprot:14574723-Heterocapsa_arctica.AAC.1